MTDDDLTTQLEAWAVATDPAADPIATADLEDMDGAATTPPRPSRGLAVAAAVLVVLGLAGAVAVTRNTDDPVDDVVLAPDPTPATSTPDDGVPVQVVLVNQAGPDVVLEWLPYECPPTASCVGRLVPAQEPGATSLVLDDSQTAPLQATFTASRCEAAGCQVVTVAPNETIGTCITASLRLDETTRAVATITRDGDGFACTLEEVDAFPPLTVPPAFSMRPRSFAVDCGAGAFDAGQLAGPADRAAAAEAFGCFAAAVGGDDLVELVTSEIEPDDFARRSWWQALPEPVDGYPIEVFRAPGDAGIWVRVRCAGIEPPSDGSVNPTLTGCTGEEPLSLAIPALDEPVAPPPTPSSIDVVLDVAEIPVCFEGCAYRWVVLVDDVEAASGPLTDIGVTPYAPDEVEGITMLVADDLAVPDAAAVSVNVETFDCFAATTCRRDSMGPTPGAVPAASCVADGPPDRAGDVLVATLRGEVCTAAWTEEAPTLWAPTEWTLRGPAPDCADLDANARWAQCLVGVALEGEGTAEWTIRDGSLRTTYRVADGALDVFTLVAYPDGLGWLLQQCTGIEAASDGQAVTPIGCGPEEPLMLPDG